MPRPLAYYDSAAGLIPCTADAKRGADITITISASRSGYRRGERLTVPAARVFPRSAVQRSFKVTPFAWITTPEGDLTPILTKFQGVTSNAD